MDGYRVGVHPSRRHADTGAGASGAAVVVPHDEHVLRGALTRDPAVLGDARLAQLIESAAVPPLERLLDTPSDTPAA